MGTRLAIQLIVAVCISFLSVLGSVVFLEDFYLKPVIKNALTPHNSFLRIF